MPIINFEQNTEEEANIIVGFASPDDIYGGQKIIAKNHPDLIIKLEKVSNLTEEEKIKLVEDFLRSYYTSNKDAYKTGFNKIQNAWAEVENQAIETLCRIMGYDSSNVPSAKAVVGSITIYPRDIKTCTFFTCYYQDVFDATTTILHEYTHFLYFDKWKTLFPQDLPDAYGGPGAIWQLSEILAGVINSDEQILNILPDADNQYFSFNGKTYCNIPMPETNYSIQGYFKKLYLEHKNKTTFEEFLEICREKILELDKCLKLSGQGC